LGLLLLDGHLDALVDTVQGLHIDSAGAGAKSGDLAFLVHLLDGDIRPTRSRN